MEIFIFIFGCSMGSFVRLVADRYLREESWIFKRSYCFHCGMKLKWISMIPLISWMIQKGKCTFCHGKIPFSYFLTELFFGLIAVFCFYFKRETGMLDFFMIAVLFLIAYLDYKTMEIDILWLSILFLLISCQLMMRKLDVSILIGMLSVSSILFLTNILFPESFFEGDIYLMALCGSLLGAKKIFCAWVLANMITGFYAIYLIVSKKADRNSHIPYAPALCTGIVVVLLANMISS